MAASGFANQTIPRQRGLLSRRQTRPTLFLVCAVFSIALLNPLLCILHCQMQHQHADGHYALGYFCDLSLSHTSGSEDLMQSDLPQTATPRAVHEAVQPSLLLTGILSGIYLALVLFQKRPHERPASPPLLPPPRISF
jgi:hypothetical protein